MEGNAQFISILLCISVFGALAHSQRCQYPHYTLAPVFLITTSLFPFAFSSSSSIGRRPAFVSSNDDDDLDDAEQDLRPPPEKVNNEGGLVQTKICSDLIIWFEKVRNIVMAKSLWGNSAYQRCGRWTSRRDPDSSYHPCRIFP